MTTTSLPTLAPVTAVILLMEMAIGTFAVIYIIDLRGQVGRGFLGTTGVICAVIAFLGLIVCAGLPGEVVIGPTSMNRASLTAGNVRLLLALVVYSIFCAIGTDGARRVVGAVAGALAAVTTYTMCTVFTMTEQGVLGAALVIVPATFLIGTALAGMLLGHWYLIAPNLSFRPLREAIYWVFAAVGIEAGALVVALAVADPTRRSMLLQTSSAPLLSLLVVGSGIVFTAVVNGLTLYFARIRANQPATAMLYVLIISVLMGIVPAHLLYFQTGIPV